MILNQRDLIPRILVSVFTLFFLWSQTASAYIHAPAVSASHELEKQTVVLHDYLHDHYDSTFGAHELEEAAEALHEALQLWSEGSSTETQVGSALRTTSGVWRDFRRQIKPSGLLSSDDTLKGLFRDTRSLFRKISFLLRKASELDSISDKAPSASHELEEAAHELHEFLHDNYPSTYGSHDLEEAAHELHEGLHDWSLGTALEDKVADLFDVVDGAWNYFRFQLDEAGLKKGSDGALNQLVRETRKAFKEVKSLLRKAD